MKDDLDLTLRPKTWEEYVGQEKVKNNLSIIIQAAKQRKESPEHILFHGGTGLGKTSLAYLVAHEIGKDIKTTSGPAIERTGDLAALLTNLEPGSILFIDEIHRLPKTIEEYLYPAMEDYKLNLVMGTGPMARIMEMNLPRFTLIGATTRPASISSPLRTRFGAMFGLHFYNIQDIEKILFRSCRILNTEADKQALTVISQSSRFTPRIANHLLKRVRDFAQVKAQGKITKALAKKALESLEIDYLGLTANDRNILQTIITKFNGGPAGLQALAAAANEEQDTILDMYEPYLMQIGFIERTSKGRIATKQAYNHLKNKTQENLF